MNMKRGLLILVVIAVLLAGMATAVSARSGSGSGDGQIVLLKPGQSLAVLCDGGAMPNVSYLRAGGVRVMCPEAAQ